MIVYVVNNSITGKRYIGKTHCTLTVRWGKHLASVNAGSKTYFHRSIKKYGKDAFLPTVLCYCLDAKELNQMESAYIKFFGTTNSDLGYNLTNGGDGSYGFKHSIETRAKISAIQSGKKRGPRPPFSEEWKRRISEGGKGRITSEETRRKLSACHKGKPRPPITDEWRRNLSLAKIGNKNRLGGNRYINGLV